MAGPIISKLLTDFFNEIGPTADGGENNSTHAIYVIDWT
jgi:hypothetical protein